MFHSWISDHLPIIYLEPLSRLIDRIRFLSPMPVAPILPLGSAVLMWIAVPHIEEEVGVLHWRQLFSDYLPFRSEREVISDVRVVAHNLKIRHICSSHSNICTRGVTMIARQFSTYNGPAVSPSTCFKPSCGRIVDTLDFKASLRPFLGNDEMINQSRRKISDSDMFKDMDASTSMSSSDDIPCVPRRKPELGAACITESQQPPVPNRRIIIRDISKLRKSSQVSRLRRHKDIHGE